VASRFFNIVLCCALCCVFSTGASAAPEPDSVRQTHVTLLVPSGTDSPFWTRIVNITREAAEDFDIHLEVIFDVHNRFRNTRTIHAISQRTDNRPDYVLLNIYLSRTQDSLAYLENSGIPYITINTDIPPAERKNVDYPQGRYKNWLASVMPDDISAGARSADYLINAARQRNLRAADDRIHLFGINGTRDTMATHFREQGLKKALAQQPDVSLKQIAYADWSQERASFLTSALLSRHPETNAIWTASDAMAMGTISELKRRGLTPGRDVLVSGTDWTAEAQEAIKEGELLVSAGGHFLDASLALAIIYDNEHGLTIPAAEADIHRPMTLIHKDNIERYQPLLNKAGWKTLNFRNLSRYHNKGLKHYPLETEDLMKLLLLK
tara:strand:- start:12614 stop:13756 length:1143 start_codon:yes stop_codon:yes gene_type:complete